MTRETHQGRPNPTHTRAVPADTTLSSAFQENAAALYRFIYAKVGNPRGRREPDRRGLPQGHPLAGRGPQRR